MATYQPTSNPIFHLFRLTIQLRGRLWNVYSTGESVEDAFNNYIKRLHERNESIQELKLVDGDLANPHAKLVQ